MNDPVPPRLYGIPATDAPVVAVLRRGPTDWSHVGRWDLVQGRYEPGAWLRGRIFPRRSDLSPDGRYLCAFVHKTGADWEHGEAYVAVSKLPWLTALHAFGTCGTWSRGYHFTATKEGTHPEDADLPIPFGLQATGVVQFANERRRGWTETASCPARVAGDTWDVQRNACLERPQPGGGRRLVVESLGRAGGEFGVDQAVDGLRVRYRLESDQGTEDLDHVQWADWDRDGRLLVATRSGHLQILDPDRGAAEPVFDLDLTPLVPDPVPPPDEAGRW